MKFSWELQTEAKKMPYRIKEKDSLGMTWNSSILDGGEEFVNVYA